MFVNGIPFFITVSHHRMFIMNPMTKDQLINPVIETIKESKSRYAKCGFCIEEMQTNRKFKPACGNMVLSKIGLSTVSKGDHVTKIERLNRTIKERVYATYNELHHHLTKISGVIIR